MTAFGARVRAALLARRPAHLRGAGGASERRSDGYEFAELRAYVEGDDPRRIDWAATARASELQMRVVYEDASLAFAAAVDAAPSMFVGRTRTSYDVACDAAALWYSAAAHDDRCYRVGTTLVSVPGARGRAAAAVCAGAREVRGTTLRAELDLARATLATGTRLLIVSDFFTLHEVARELRACVARFDVTALVSCDPWGGALPLGGFARLRDAATGDVARVFVGARARVRYARAVAVRESGVRAELAAYGARVALLSPEAAPELALGAALGL